MVTTQTGQMTLDEFIHRYEEEGPFEILHGEIIPVSPVVALHAVMIKRLMKRLLSLPIPLIG